MNIVLRDYQKNAIETIHTMESNIGLIMSATGSGKTIVFATIAAQASGRVLITVPSTELREQTIEKLQLINPELDIGSVQAGLDEVDAKIVVSTRQSLTHKKSTRIQRMLEHGEFEYLICDEVHQAPYQLQTIIDKVNDGKIKILGFTATPYTKECIKTFGKPIFVKSIYNLILEEYLCEPKALQVFSKTDLSNVKTVGGEFVQRDLEEAVNIEERNELVVEAYKKYASNRKSTLVFASGINHSNELAKEFNKHGIYAKSVDSKLDSVDRDEILNEFKSGKLPVICNCKILTTGFDHPPTDCIIMARPLKSRILYEQVLGRGLRISDDKEDCLVIDVRDIVKNHDLMDISTVFDFEIRSGETPSQAQDRIAKEKEEEKLRRLEEERLRKERERKRQEELELYAQQVKLFNKEMSKRFKDAYLDWFKVDISTYGVSMNSDVHFVVEQELENEFNVFKVVTEKGNKNIEMVNTGNNILEVIDYVENYLVSKPTSFSYRNSEWKLNKATDRQRDYCPWAKTKWEVTCYFKKKDIKWLLKKYKMSN